MRKSRVGSIPKKELGKGLEIRMSRVRAIPKKRAGDEDEDEQSWLHPPKKAQEGVRMIRAGSILLCGVVGCRSPWFCHRMITSLC